MVQPCPVCHEFIVLFRGKTIALNRAILEKGSFDERKAHIAEIIAEFLEPDLLSGAGSTEDGEEAGSPFDGLFRSMAAPEDGPADDASDDVEDEEGDDGDETESDDEGEAAISDEEVEQFVRVDLKKLDDPRYFREHFG